MSSYNNIKKQYQNSFALHGDSPESILTPKRRNHLRYSVLNSFVDSNEGLRILDYGCGLGYLYSYLTEINTNIDYHGLDIIPEFIETCKGKFPEISDQFNCINEHHCFDQKFDIIFASGVFNLASHVDEQDSKKHTFERLKFLFEQTNNILVCDFPSEFVDFKQDNSLHYSLSEVSNFTVNQLSRKFMIRHDILPYEFSLIVWKDDSIIRSKNTFSN